MVQETGVQSQVELYERLDASLLNIQHYKIQIKGKWSNPGKGVTPSLVVVTIEKGAFGLPSFLT